jgi:phosphate transport system substrate-binding protein
MLRVILVLSCFAFAVPANARDQIRVVGSSTVFPFVAAAAEQFGKMGKFRTPIVEATGTGGGLKMFCDAPGLDSPDMANASRQIKPDEVALCASNGVKDITELKIGYDGIVLANSTESPDFDLNKTDVFLALAQYVPSQGKLVPNFYDNWNEINPKLPVLPIRVYGPPPTSGTRDAFVELVMDKACEEFAEFEKAYPDKELRKKQCMTIREDGAFVEAGENDNLIVQKLVANPETLGVFGYSFLEENAATVKANPINQVIPNFEAIVSGEYKVARSLYVYVKNSHANMVPGLREFAVLLTSDAAVGDDGFLILKGLLPLPADEHKTIKDAAKNLTPMAN